MGDGQKRVRDYLLQGGVADRVFCYGLKNGYAKYRITDIDVNASGQPVMVVAHEGSSRQRELPLGVHLEDLCVQTIQNDVDKALAHANGLQRESQPILGSSHRRREKKP